MAAAFAWDSIAASSLLLGGLLVLGLPIRRPNAARREGGHFAGCAPRERTSARQAGSMSAAPTRKHTAPSNVPALSSGRSSTAPVLGTTKPAIADTMKATEPSMLSHAIHHGKFRDRGRNPPPRVARQHKMYQYPGAIPPWNRVFGTRSRLTG